MARRRVAFLGPRGTYSEQAALRIAPDAGLIPAAPIAAVVTAVLEGRADEAVVPIENSLEGAVTETLDLLVHQLDLRIRGEVALPIAHCLIGRPGAKKTSIRTVYSHPQALAQCRGYLARELPAARTQASLSTAEAVETVMREDGVAAIAAHGAAALHGAEVLEEGIQDDSSNETRFVLLAAADAAPSGDDKTSLAFNVADQPGALVAILQQFAAADINLTKIESRPSRIALGEYIFLLDCAGHRSRAPLDGVLASLQRQTTWLKILGSYPRHRRA